MTDQNTPQPPADLYERCNTVAGDFVPPSGVGLAYSAGRDAHEQELRKWLWLNHGCPISRLYGDDGEMQCGAPSHKGADDFKRQPLTEIIKALVTAGYAAGLADGMKRYSQSVNGAHGGKHWQCLH